MVKYFFLTRLFTYIIHQGFCTFHVYYNNITTQQKSTQDIGHTLQYRSAATVPNESCPMRVIVYLSKHCSSTMVFGFRQYIHEIRKCSNHHTVRPLFSKGSKYLLNSKLLGALHSKLLLVIAGKLSQYGTRNQMKVTAMFCSLDC